MLQIELVHFFVHVVRSGSFTRASEVLRVPKSILSKAVSRLESDTGTKLLMRTTRTQTLTAAGKALYDSCVGPIEAIEEAQKSISGADNVLTGTLKITAPEDLGANIITPACAQLAKKHPGLRFQLNYTDQLLDLVKDGYDLAVRIGQLKESGLKSRRVGEVKLVLVASPGFLKSRGKISAPQDLKSCPCFNLSGVKPLWSLRTSTGDSAQVAIQARIISNHMSGLVRAAVAGAGVALVPAFLAMPKIETGELVRVLPAWTSQGMPVHMLSPLSFSASTRLKLVSDALIAELRQALLDK